MTTINVPLAPDRRGSERRVRERRSAAESLDVSRIEHENLLKQVEANTRLLHRLEEDVRQLKARMASLTDRAPRPRAR